MKLSLDNLIRSLLFFSVFLIPFYIFRFNLLVIPTNIFETVVFVTFLIYIAGVGLYKKRIKFESLDWFILAFLIFSFVAVVISPSATVALGIFKGWFMAPALFYFMLSRTISRNDVGKLAVPLFFALAFVTGWSLLQKYGIIGATFYQRGDTNFDQFLSGNVRTFGPFESPNFLAMFIVPVLILCLPLIHQMKDTFSKIIMSMLLIAPVIILISTKSRGGLFALLAALSMLAFIQIARKLKVQKLIWVKFAAVALIAIAIFLVYKIGFDPGRDYARLDIYRYSFEMIKTDGLFGIGYANFQNKIAALSMGDIKFQSTVLPYALHPHNVFLAMWLYLGIGGLIAFLLMLWQFFKKVFQSLDHPFAPYAFAAMVAILAHGLFDTTYYKNDLSAIFFLILAVAVVLSSKENLNN